MASVEEDFPRGGKVPKKDQAQYDPFPQKEKRGRKDAFEISRRPGKRKHSESDVEDTEELKRVKHTQLLGRILPKFNKAVCEGMLVLGCIKEIGDFELKVSLPDHLVGTVPVTCISDAYRSLMNTISNPSLENITQEEIELPSLSEMFRIGMVLRCKVTSVEKVKGRKKIILSINPRDVNSEITASAIVQGMTLTGAIESKEDHGYIVDIGVREVRAFLKNKDAEKYLQVHHQGSPFSVGQLCLCQILHDVKSDSGLIRTVNVTVNPKKVADVSPKLPFNQMVPGMKFEANIQSIFEDGLILKFQAFRGNVLSSHLMKRKYEKHDKVVASILYIHPTSKAITMTMLKHLVDHQGLKAGRFTAHKIGSDLKLEVLKSFSRHGVYFKVDGTLSGFASITNLPFNKKDDITQEFTPGSKHKCRIVNFDYLSDVAVLSLKESVLQQPYLNIHELKPGQIVEGAVKEVKDSGVLVTLAGNNHGFIPNLHLADVPLQHPEKKFKIGLSIKCRVLKVYKSNVLLTIKKSLLSSKLPIVSSYEELEQNTVVEGFVAKVTQFGVLIAFYNDVKGWVPKDELSGEGVEIPEKLYFLGQVVRCHVKSVSVPEQKAKLTFKMDGRITNAGQQSDFKLGKITMCEVVDKNENGLVVKMMPCGNHSFLPKEHLTDNQELSDLLLEVFEEGNKINEVMYLSRTIVSKRHSLIQAAKLGYIVQDFTDLEIGMMLIGLVQNVVSFGVFVEFPGGFHGLAPNKFLADRWMSNGSSHFNKNQTVMAKVTRINMDEKNIGVSLKLSDCSDYYGFQMLRNYLKDMNFASSRLNGFQGDKRSKLTCIKVGEVINVRVTDIHEKGIVCTTERACKGFATEYHLGGNKVHVNESLQVVVLCVDLVKNCFEFSMRDNLIKAAKSEKVDMAERLGKTMKAEVVLIKEEFVLVCLSTGCFAFLPSCKNWNDVLKLYSFTLGETRNVVIRSSRSSTVASSFEPIWQSTWPPDLLTSGCGCQGDFSEVVDRGIIIVILPECNTGEWKREVGFEEKSIAKQTLFVGDCVKATIIKKKIQQMLLRIDRRKARVHICDVNDEYIKNQWPFNKYRVNQEVTVRIIAGREPGATKPDILTCNSKKRIKTVPDCSLKPSAFKITDFTKFLKSPEEGEEVLAYFSHFKRGYLWMNVTAYIQGRVRLKNASKNPENLKNNITDHFKRGHCYKAKVLQKIDDDVLELALLDDVCQSSKNEKRSSDSEAHIKGLFSEVVHPSKSAKQTAVCEEESEEETMSQRKSEICKGVIERCNYSEGICVSIKDGQKHGIVGLTDIQDNFEDLPLSKFHCGQTIKCAVIQNSNEKKTCRLSLRESRLSASDSEPLDRDIENISEIKKGDILRGYVTKHCLNRFIVSVGHNISGVVPKGFMTVHHTDHPQKIFYLGKLVTAKVISIDGKELLLSLLEKHTGVKAQEPPVNKKPNTLIQTEKIASEPKADKASSDQVQKKEKISKKKETEKRKISESSSEEIPVKKSKKAQWSKNKKDMQTEEKQKNSVPCLQLETGFTWDANFSLPVTMSTENDDSEEESDSSVEIKTKCQETIQTTKDDEERNLYELEMNQLEGKQSLETPDDYERLLLQSPNSSLVWMRYMAFYLESSNIEKARSIAIRALDRISFREQQEKLNVWVAYLNLENMYGTSESLQDVLQKALQHNDLYKIYHKLIKIYEESEKIEDAEMTYSIVVRKFSLNKDVWNDFGLFYYKNGKINSARKLLQRSFKSLEKKDQVDVIAKFAQMEFRFGDAERGKTMFENILSNYPKRTDLWSVYIDMVAKYSDVEAVRLLFERVITMKLSAKRMKFFFKKYLDFEMKNGDEDTIESVKQKALNYVNAHGDTDE